MRLDLSGSLDITGLSSCPEHYFRSVETPRQSGVWFVYRDGRMKREARTAFPRGLKRVLERFDVNQRAMAHYCVDAPGIVDANSVTATLFEAHWISFRETPCGCIRTLRLIYLEKRS